MYRYTYIMGPMHIKAVAGRGYLRGCLYARASVYTYGIRCVVYYGVELRVFLIPAVIWLLTRVSEWLAFASEEV